MEGILIPVKAMSGAKRRLATGLDAKSIRRLGLAMLADVLRACDKWEARYVATSDPDAEAVALAFGCRLVEDKGLGLNEALIAGSSQAVRDGVEALTVLPSDVPLVASHDINALFRFEADVVVAPSRDGGTNALLRRPPRAIDPKFGLESARFHIDEATLLGLRAELVHLDSLALDIDSAQDLLELASHFEERESVKVAREVLRNATG